MPVLWDRVPQKYLLFVCYLVCFFLRRDWKKNMYHLRSRGEEQVSRNRRFGHVKDTCPSFFDVPAGRLFWQRMRIRNTVNRKNPILNFRFLSFFFRWKRWIITTNHRFVWQKLVTILVLRPDMNDYTLNSPADLITGNLRRRRPYSQRKPRTNQRNGVNNINNLWKLRYKRIMLFVVDNKIRAVNKLANFAKMTTHVEFLWLGKIRSIWQSICKIFILESRRYFIFQYTNNAIIHNCDAGGLSTRWRVFKNRFRG